MSTSRRQFIKKTLAVGSGMTFGQSLGNWSSKLGISSIPLHGSQGTFQSSSREVPTRADVVGWYREGRNWGRWGNDDQVGAVNLVTDEKRQRAASLVKTGHSVSLSRTFEPAQHFVRKNERDSGSGSFVDYYGFIYHGQTITHIDALCHVWEDEHEGTWQGMPPDQAGNTHGAQFGSITAWSDGIITRGVLLDVPRYRGTSYVTQDRPVHGWELEEIARAQGVDVLPGDALLIHSGREAYDRTGDTWGQGTRPGLDGSCVKYIRDRDIALLGWDMMDARPNEYGLRYPVHGVLPYFGVALLDNALLEPVADACNDEGRYEFMFMALPLKVARGTGSPANPIAMF